MNKRDLRPIHKELLRDLPGFVAHKHMLLIAPMNGMLRAIDFDPSGFSKDDFDVQSLVMPLCVPTDHIYLTYGDSLEPPGPPRGWRLSMPDLVPSIREAIRKTALPFLGSIQSGLDFATMARNYWAAPHARMETAFALARAGHTALSLSVLDEAVIAYAKLSMDYDWEVQLFEDTRNFRDLLHTDPDEAQRKLIEWENYTIEKLGLERFR